MKILFIGNSQLTCIKLAYDAEPQLIGQTCHFSVFPGGRGPKFTIRDGKLDFDPQAINAEFPPRFNPPSIRETSLKDYDAILISALGYVDGGFAYQNDVLHQGVIAEFRPKTNKITDRLVSKNCFRSLFEGYFELQDGFRFVEELRADYSGLIVCQPFPLHSSSTRTNPNWILNQLYHDAIGAHEFILSVRDDYLYAFCSRLDIVALPYPDTSWRESLFTPSEFMRAKDGIHPNELYGKMVLEQFATAVADHLSS